MWLGLLLLFQLDQYLYRSDGRVFGTLVGARVGALPVAFELGLAGCGLELEAAVALALKSMVIGICFSNTIFRL